MCHAVVRMILKSVILLVSILTTTQPTFANVVGSDHQNFNPTTSGLDFVTVQSGQTLDPGIVNFGFFTNYAANTLSFLEKSNPQLQQSKTQLNDKLWSADFNVGLGLTENWDIGLSLPVLLSQEIDNKVQVAYFSETGNTEQRLNTKYRLVNSPTHALAVVASFNHNNIRNNPYVGEDAGLTYNLEIANSWKQGAWWYGANVGHRWRDQGKSLASEFSFDPIPNQYIASLAASRHIAKWDIKWISELYGSLASENTGQNLSNRDYQNLEFLSGVKWDASKNMALHAGAATEVISGFGSPDYRIYAGLNYVIGPVWKTESRDVVELKKSLKSRTFVLRDLKFKFDSDILEEESQPAVEKIVAILREIGKFTRAEVEGHTDSMGADEYNQQLSQRRADAIARQFAALLNKKIDTFTATGFGETKPIADNGNFQGRAENRRVVVTVFTEDDEYKLSK